jgi:hypothetical protein
MKSALKNTLGLILVIGISVIVAGVVASNFQEPVERVIEYRTEVVQPRQPNLGAAPAGLRTRLVSNTVTTVGPQLVAHPVATTTPVHRVLFLGNTSCQARVITTLGTGIQFTYGVEASSTTLSSTKGHFQAASTTVVYDASVWGCGVVSGWAAASTSVSVSEFE